MSLLDIPVELLPRLLADPLCAREVAATCRDMFARVPRRLFLHSYSENGGVVSSEYYTHVYKWHGADFLCSWNRHAYDFEKEHSQILTDCKWKTPQFLIGSEHSWIGVIPFTHSCIRRYVYKDTFAGEGAHKFEKAALFTTAAQQWRAGECECMLIGRQPLWDIGYREHTIVMFGKTKTIMELSRLVAQPCAVFRGVA